MAARNCALGLLLVELVEICVLRDRADTFLLGARLYVALEEPAEEGDLPNALLFLGVSEANCSTVETLWGGLGSGVPGLEFRRMLMNPYLSTSFPLTSSQSSIPPAISCSFFSLLLDKTLKGRSILPLILGLSSPFDL